MKRIITILLGTILSVNVVLAQWQTDAPKSHDRKKSVNAVSSLKDINTISGSVTSINNYIPGGTMVLNFNLTFASSDAEYWDGMSMTFPTGMTPNTTGTSDPIAAHNNSCTAGVGQLNPISGQTVTWGELTTPTGCGWLSPNTFIFSVGVTIGAITGAQTISYTVYGDGYGSAPHSFTGTITVNEAVPNDVGATLIDIQPFYQPGNTVSPVVTVENFGSAAQTFDVSLVFNDGTSNVYTQTQTVTALAASTTQLVTFPDWTAVLGNYTATAATLLTGDALTTNDTATKSFVCATAFTSYAWNAYDPASVIPEGPLTVLIPAGVINSIVTDASDFMAGADFVNDVWYGAQYSQAGNSSIYTIDKTTGTKTLVGASGIGITGLAYDVTNSKLYASNWLNNVNSLYTINTGTGASTLVAPIATDGLIIGIACNNAGELYGITLNDTLVAIDKATGAVTNVGPLGVDINYAQDIAYDRDNNVLYGTLYTTEGILAEINTTTGAANTLAVFGAEVTGFAIPYTFTLPDDDVMVQSITAIESACGMSTPVQINITVYNGGNNPQSNIPVYYTINGGAQVTGTVPGPIAAGATATYQFTQTADFSAYGTYVIEACTNLSGDNNTNNDCNSITTTNIQPSTVPYLMGFETTEDFSGWKIQDVNSDNFLWEFTTSTTLAHTGTGLAIYEYNAGLEANDWLFTKCINLNAGTDYEVSFWYRVGDFQGTTYPEKLKVAIGTAPVNTSMTQVINDLGTINNITYTKHASTFTVPTNGTYYIGWHAYSDADMFYIALDDVKVDVASGISDKSDESNISIYPNPVKEQLHINSTNNISKIKIYNAIGQLITDVKVDTNYHTINTSNFNYGIYFIQIESKEGMVTKKFVIAE